MRITKHALADLEPRGDPFCSLPLWGLSWHEAFAPGRDLYLFGTGKSGVALAGSSHPAAGLFLEPLEAMWCLGTPLYGPAWETPLLECLKSLPPAATVFLSGIPLDPAFVDRLAATLPTGWQGGIHGEVQRMEASLRGGVLDFLSRRSRNMRVSIKQGQKRCRKEGVCFEQVSVSPESFEAVYEQILAVESTSWKSLSGNGANQGSMRLFYSALIPRLLKTDDFRLIFALHRNEPIGYIHGGVAGQHFRGLQFSYNNRFRALGLGNALQMEMIQWLSQDGITTYDLGSEADYKTRWSDPDGLRTLNVVLQRKQEI